MSFFWQNTKDIVVQRTVLLLGAPVSIVSVVWTFHNSTLHMLSSLLSLCPILRSVLATFCWLLFLSPYLVVSVVQTFYNLSLDLSGVSYLFTCKSILHPCHIELALVLQSLPCCFSCVDIL